MLKVVGLFVVILLASGCGRGRGTSPLVSPDGSMTLSTRIEQSRSDPRVYLCVIFEIRDRSGRVFHTENTRASHVMRWEMSWVASDRIRLESSDIGTFEWTRQAEGGWLKELVAKSRTSGHQ